MSKNDQEMRLSSRYTASIIYLIVYKSLFIELPSELKQIQRRRLIRRYFLSVTLEARVLSFCNN